MRRWVRFSMLLLVTVVARVPAWAADVVIYDDATRNGFDQGCSFGGVAGDFNFANTVAAFVHSGSDSIRFTPDHFNALSWCTPGEGVPALTTTSYSGVSFWINGGTTGNQDVDIVLGVAGDPVAFASLATLNGAPIPANTWVHINAMFASGALAYSGQFDHISLQEEADATQPDLYLDDVSLLGPVSQLPDEIFKNNFEALTMGAPMIPIVAQQNFSTPCADQTNGATPSVSTERYTWQDSNGLARSATLSHNDGQIGFEGTRGGELCDYTYHTSIAAVREVTPSDYTSGGGGFGYIVSHLGDTTPADQLGMDDSPLGHQFTGTFTRVLSGRHHAILRFQQSYPRYYDDVGNNAHTYHMPVTVEWLVATGHDHPLWTVSYDLKNGTIDNSPTPTQAPADRIHADSRAPYGDMAFDGNASNPDDVGGAAWGDRYKFLTTNSPLTMNSAWTWTASNSVPFNYLWTNSVDAEMGLVQSQNYLDQDAGGYDNVNTASLWNTTVAGLPSHQGCPNGAAGAEPSNYAMPCQSAWPYQLVQYSFYNGNTFERDQATGDKRLAWGANFGFLGQSSFNYHTCADGSCNYTGSGYPYQSYSIYVVLDRHSVTPTLGAVSQVESIAQSSLAATIGTVLAQGPAGVNRSDLLAYHPTGYNRVYGTWDLNASANKVALVLSAAGSGILRPIFVLHNYTSASPPATVTLDGGTLAADADYFATVDSANSRLWITINANWTGSHSLTVN